MELVEELDWLEDAELSVAESWLAEELLLAARDVALKVAEELAEEDVELEDDEPEADDEEEEDAPVLPLAAKEVELMSLPCPQGIAGEGFSGWLA